jgi:hypothetical protein
MKLPDDLKGRDWWVVWDFDETGRKRPRAPWLYGHSYPAAWGSDTDKRPETDYSTAMVWCDLPTGAIQKEAPAPEDGIDLKPGLILPHDNENDILFVDLDDVRDVETGELTPEAEAIVRRLGSWTEISSSGTGVHIFVRGELEGHTRILADLDQEGHIEIYKQARFAGLTGNRHELSTDDVRDAHDEISAIVDRYAPEEPDNETGDMPNLNREKDALAQIGNPTDEGERSPYYDLEPADVVPLRHFERERNGTLAGAHPVHGGVHNDDADSTNTAVSEGVWYCHAHDSKGGALEMRAIEEGIISCRESDFGCLSDAQLLEVCRSARDEVPEDAKPPYRALRALAKEEDLELSDEDDGILGKSAYQVALDIWRTQEVVV